MKRTQIYIPEETHLGAQIVADRMDTSVAEGYRNYIEAGLKKEKKKQGSASALLDLNFKGGPKDFSKNFDKYAYD